MKTNSPIATEAEPNAKGNLVTHAADFPRPAGPIEETFRKARDVLASLDALGLSQAAAYVAMAMEVMRARYPELPSFE